MISFPDLFAVMHELKMSKFTSRFGRNTEKLVETKHRFLLNETFKNTNTDQNNTDVFFAGVTKILTQYLIFSKNKMPQRRSCSISSLDVAIASAMPVFLNAMWEERWNAPTHVRTHTHTDRANIKCTFFCHQKASLKLVLKIKLHFTLYK